MQEVLRQLLGNAIKFTSRRETPIIEVELAHAGADDVLMVRDNGVGFDMADSDLLFVPFKKLHDSAGYEGSGLGLSIATRIMERQGGKLLGTGVPGSGATFCVILPQTGTSIASP